MAATKERRNFDFIVVGGGIAGVSCTEYLSNLNNDKTICLISSTDLVKAVCNIRKITRTVEEFDVKEKPLDSVACECENVTVVKATVVGFEPTGIRYFIPLTMHNCQVACCLFFWVIDHYKLLHIHLPVDHKVVTSDKGKYGYKKLCICTGARPNLISEENEHILGLRDLQSVEYFQNRLTMANRVIIVGNGGIALELV